MKQLSDLTSHCIRCGFCLESCPTFVLTGHETESPRGRIYLARNADEGTLDWEAARLHLDRCLGCRACETACPSGVEYGAILEIARDRLEGLRGHATKRALLSGMTNPKALRAQLGLGRLLPGKKVPALLSRLLSGEAPEVDRPRPRPARDLPPLDESRQPSLRGEVYLLEGCAMRVLFPAVHQATRRLLRRIGFAVRETDQGCCGALHAHNGYLDQARSLAEGLVGAMPEDLPVVVNSAGCGSTMKEYGALLGPGVPSEALVQPQDAEPETAQATAAEGRKAAREMPGEPSARLARQAAPAPPPNGGAGGAFARRVLDVSEFLLSHGLVEALRESEGVEGVATYHDACHLAHGQGVRSEPRALLEAVPGLRLVPLPESEMCCGSAGIYNLTQPKLARDLLERKWANVEKTGASLVATGNPGCHAWIEQASREHGGQVRVLHTIELLEAAFSGLPAVLGD
jgi:glycolate oxidase iron-sulfur subunit